MEVKKIKWFQLLEIILITELVGVLSSLLSGNVRNDYLSFNKPPLSPPGFVFGIVWVVLYAFMAIAVYMIYQEEKSTQTQKAITLYWFQLFVNFLWPIVFFRFEFYWFAVGVIILLDILVALTTIMFFKINKLAGYLMLPYLLWVLFATYLNIGVALLNQ